jgi:hypothetical protein
MKDEIATDRTVEALSERPGRVKGKRERVVRG